MFGGGRQRNRGGRRTLFTGPCVVETLSRSLRNRSLQPPVLFAFFRPFPLRVWFAGCDRSRPGLCDKGEGAFCALPPQSDWGFSRREEWPSGETRRAASRGVAESGSAARPPVLVAGLAFEQAMTVSGFRATPGGPAGSVAATLLVLLSPALILQGIQTAGCVRDDICRRHRHRLPVIPTSIVLRMLRRLRRVCVEGR
jgi:hypothetical protein